MLSPRGGTSTGLLKLVPSPALSAGRRATKPPRARGGAPCSGTTRRCVCDSASLSPRSGNIFL
jgi:hypothetical protein